MAKNLGDQWEDFAAGIAAWNKMIATPRFYKNGRPIPPRKKPINALAVVGAIRTEVLVWDEDAKRRALHKLWEEEEERRAAGEYTEGY